MISHKLWFSNYLFPVFAFSFQPFFVIPSQRSASVAAAPFRVRHSLGEVPSQA